MAISSNGWFLLIPIYRGIDNFNGGKLKQRKINVSYHKNVAHNF